MSSCARLSAFLDSILASASGFRACIALFRDSAFGGAAQDFASLLGRTAVMFHFRQLNLTFRLWLAWSEATQSSRLLKTVQASFRVVPAGSRACNSSVNFLSSAPF